MSFFVVLYTSIAVIFFHPQDCLSDQTIQVASRRSTVRGPVCSRSLACSCLMMVWLTTGTAHHACATASQVWDSLLIWWVLHQHHSRHLSAVFTQHCGKSWGLVSSYGQERLTRCNPADSFKDYHNPCCHFGLNNTCLFHQGILESSRMLALCCRTTQSTSREDNDAAKWRSDCHLLRNMVSCCIESSTWNLQKRSPFPAASKAKQLADANQW